MKKIFTLLLSFVAFGSQTFAQEVIHAGPKEEVTALYAKIGAVLKGHQYRGHVPSGKLFKKRCTAFVGNSGSAFLSASIYENKLINLGGFSEQYHAEPMATLFIGPPDRLTGSSKSSVPIFTDSLASVGAIDKEGTTQALILEKKGDDTVLVTIETKSNSYETSVSCLVDLNKRVKN